MERISKSSANDAPHGVVPALPAPETVAAYLAAHASTSKASTLGRRVAAIRYAYKLAGLALPTDAEGVNCQRSGHGLRARYAGKSRHRLVPAMPKSA
jgi:hypothetical protein